MIYNIGNVKINKSFYSGQDLYSDGDIENELLKIVKSESDYSQIISSDNRWPILYHLSPNRRNLLEWYHFNNNLNLLEVGAGCGALTGLFCERLNNVVAIELSKRRSEIIAYRHKAFSNLEIIIGNISDIILKESFDYITLIGVLEYAPMFNESENPFTELIKHIKQYLKKGGTLILAIENKFGLKYWAGAGEDHTGGLFQSLEGYSSEEKVRTFSKDELKDILNSVGFNSLQYYYPMPDYKLVSQVFSDNYLPSIGQVDKFFPNYDRERLILFNEQKVYNNLIENRKFDFFSNSFLIFCKEEVE